MSDMATGDEFLSLEQFAADVAAELEREDNADTAEAPAESTETPGDTDGEDTAEAPELKEDATGRLHDKDGKFAEKPKPDDAPADDQEEEETDDEPEFVLEVDDEETAERVSKVLEKYDGDPAKALIALAEAQSLIGRKGNEASQSAAEAAALRAELAELRRMQEQTLQRISNPTVLITQELIEEDPATAAQQAVLQDNAAALEAAIAVWREENPDAANLFLRNLVLEAQMSERQAAAPQATTPTATADTEAVDAEVAKVLERHPDLEKHLPAIGKAADANPLLKRALELGNPQEKAQALEALAVIAKAGTTADTSREAMKRVQIRVKQEADEARRSAAVVSARRSSAAPSSQPTKTDEFLAAFDARLGLQPEEA